MKRTTNGYQKRIAPSKAPHPEFQRGPFNSSPDFNGPLNPHPGNWRLLPPRPAAPRESWWVQPDDAAFTARQRIEQQRMSSSVTPAKVPTPNEESA